MRLIATDTITRYHPNLCDVCVWLRHQGEPQRESTQFEEVFYQLGERHDLDEKNHSRRERNDL